MAETKRQRQISEHTGIFADLTWGPVLVNTILGVRLSPSNAHTGPEEAATKCGFAVPKEVV